ncbi:hypothetical protein DSECCO2_584890 [anaerobic digester metagenome]
MGYRRSGWEGQGYALLVPRGHHLRRRPVHRGRGGPGDASARGGVQQGQLRPIVIVLILQLRVDIGLYRDLEGHEGTVPMVRVVPYLNPYADVAWGLGSTVPEVGGGRHRQSDVQDVAFVDDGEGGPRPSFRKDPHAAHDPVADILQGDGGHRLVIRIEISVPIVLELHELVELELQLPIHILVLLIYPLVRDAEHAVLEIDGEAVHQLVAHRRGADVEAVLVLVRGQLALLIVIVGQRGSPR